MKATDKTYEALRTEIMNGILAPGAVLAEVEQAERFGVSRTPVREAISRLLADGLAEPLAGRGVIVAPLSLNKAIALFELRVSLDCTQAALAAVKGDSEEFTHLAQRFVDASDRLNHNALELDDYYKLVAEFDDALDRAADNPYLIQAQNNLRGHLTRIRKLSQENPQRLVQAAREHAQIARSVASGEPQLAEAAVTLHLHQALEEIKKASQKPEHGFYAAAA